MLFFLIFFVALAVLVPLFGFDSRDGRDWKPAPFLRREPSAPVRRTGSRARAAVARGAAPAHRKAQAAC
jgi:hypothetical protein